MRFHLNHIPKASEFKISHDKSVFLLGSCFSENIGDYFKSYKFKTVSNPGGILFNPASIANTLQRLITEDEVDEKFIVERDGLFYSLLNHSSLSSATKQDLVQKLYTLEKQSAEVLKTADVLIITFGSAFVYRHRELNKTVANCHKLPASVFEKKLLKVEQITKNYSVLIQQLQLFNPGLKIIFTVSPVKYLRDGVVENNLSKATLLLSVSDLVNKFSNCAYFPAFELINDDLRDYRFYKEDLAHPNEQAIEYVWQKFSECYFNDTTRHLNQQIAELNKALNHRSITSADQKDSKFTTHIDRLKEELLKSWPTLTL